MKKLIALTIFILITTHGIAQIDNTNNTIIENYSIVQSTIGEWLGAVFIFWAICIFIYFRFPNDSGNKCKPL